jgi:hypothetical protein
LADTYDSLRRIGQYRRQIAITRRSGQDFFAEIRDDQYLKAQETTTTPFWSQSSTDRIARMDIFFHVDRLFGAISPCDAWIRSQLAVHRLLKACQRTGDYEGLEEEIRANKEIKQASYEQRM